jgi:hypothetical protein
MPNRQLNTKVADMVRKPKSYAQIFYGSQTSRGALFLGTNGLLWNPALGAHLGKMGMGPKPEGGWDEFGMPLNKTGKPYSESKDKMGLF